VSAPGLASAGPGHNKKGNKKGNMKKLLIAVLLVTGLACEAQTYGTLTLGTNDVPAAYTNTAAVSSALNTLGRTSVSLFASANSAVATNETSFVMTFQVSGNGTDWYDAGTNYQLALPLKGLDTATAWNKFDVSGFQYLRVGTYENIAEAPATNYVTNITVKYFWK